MACSPSGEQPTSVAGVRNEQVQVQHIDRLLLFPSHGRVALTSASAPGHGTVGEIRPRPDACAIILFKSSSSALIHLVAKVVVFQSIEVLLLRSPQCFPLVPCLIVARKRLEYHSAQGVGPTVIR